MIKKFLSACFLFGIICNDSFATHIIGGTLTYEHLGGNTYNIMLRLYKDCPSTSFPATVSIEVHDSNGVYLSAINIPFPGSTQIPNNIPCVSSTGICVQEAVYSIVVNNLPARPGGYHLYTQMCCRSASILNIVNPLNTGDSWNTFIPDGTIYLQNSSPQWTGPLPIMGCTTVPLTLSFSASDADGDSLVHSWYTPYRGSDAPPPTYPGNWIAFLPITWQSGYSQNNPCGGPNWIINPTTGAVTGTPPNIGTYIIGVKVEEYRNGIKIGEIVRDWNFSVVNCIAPVAAFTTQDTICLGQTSSFANASSGDSTYYWDFGVPISTVATSTFSNPAFTYTSAGTYIVTLVINPGQGFCADTTYDTISVQVCMNVNELKQAEIILFPNPADDEIYFSLNRFGEGEINLSLTDITGKIIYSQKYFSLSGKISGMISLVGISKGIYFFKVQNANQLLVKKLIVQ